MWTLHKVGGPERRASHLGFALDSFYSILLSIRCPCDCLGPPPRQSLYWALNKPVKPGPPLSKTVPETRVTPLSRRLYLSQGYMRHGRQASLAINEHPHYINNVWRSKK